MRVLVVGRLLALLIASPVAIAAPPVPQIPVADFAALPQIDSPELSPNGRYVAAKLFTNGQYMLVVFDLENLGKSPPKVISPRDMEVAWLHWKRDDRLLVSVWFNDRRYGTPTTESRLFAMKPDGADVKLLVAPRRLLGSKTDYQDPVQYGDRVVNFLPDDPKHVLMSFNPEDPRLPRLYRVDIDTDQHKLVEGGKAGVQQWFADQQGRPRVATGVEDKTMRWRMWLKAPDGDDWQLYRDEGVDEGPDFDPVMFDKADPDLLYVRSNHEGGTLGLYKFRLSTKTFVDRLFLNPDVDVGHPIMDPTDTEIQGVPFVVDTARTTWFRPRYQEVLKEVSSRVSARLVSVASASADYRRYLIYGESPDLPPRYYLYEPEGQKLQYFSYGYPALEKKPLAPMVATSFKARDGLLIPAYLSLPPGVTTKPEKPLPTVIFPHGGPASRDMEAFDSWVQLFANRGYAVLQINFRGSTGYGTDFKMAGARQWGQAMQDDVTDGTRWLIAAGVGDPKRICIVGASYGGYAALMGAVKEPSLYRCTASISGVADLRELVADQRAYRYARIRTRFIGEYWKDRESLEQNSPVNRAAAITVPVLLAHGTKDRTVEPEQSAAMARALKKAGKDYRYLEVEDADHYFLRAEHRLKLLGALDEFLAENLAAPAN